jgi:hypothetical protein
MQPELPVEVQAMPSVDFYSNLAEVIPDSDLMFIAN